MADLELMAKYETPEALLCPIGLNDVIKTSANPENPKPNYRGEWDSL